MKEQIKELLQQGFTQKEISKQLNVSAPYISILIKKYDLKQFKIKIERKHRSITKCSICGETDSLKFTKFNRSVCKSCIHIQRREHRRDCKSDIVNYKGGKCQICGYNKSIFALELHHIDPKTKDAKIVRVLSKSRKFNLGKYKEELDKCILLCCNCHKEVHRDITQLPI